MASFAVGAQKRAAHLYERLKSKIVFTLCYPSVSGRGNLV